MNERPCHMCGNFTEFICGDCEQPVCEDCIAVPTIHNHEEGTRCNECYDSAELLQTEEYQREEDLKQAKDEKRKKRNYAAWTRYHSSKQLEKRKLAKIELIKARRRQYAETINTVNDMLKGF